MSGITGPNGLENRLYEAVPYKEAARANLNRIIFRHTESPPGNRQGEAIIVINQILEEICGE